MKQSINGDIMWQNEVNIQCTLVIVNPWIVNNLSLVNIFGEAGRFFYKINYMLSLANKIGDKTEFTITRVHCTIVANSSDPITENLCLARFLGPGKNCVTNLSAKLKGHKYLFILLINLIYSNQFHMNECPCHCWCDYHSMHINAKGNNQFHITWMNVFVYYEQILWRP